MAGGIRWSQLDQEEFKSMFLVKEGLVPNKLIATDKDNNLFSVDFDIDTLGVINTIEELIKTNNNNIGTSITKDYKNKEILDNELGVYNNDNISEIVSNIIKNSDDVITISALTKLLTVILGRFELYVRPSLEAPDYIPADVGYTYTPIKYSDANEENLDISSYGAYLFRYSGATENTDGKGGLVPSPTIEDRNKFLKGDGTWGSPETDGLSLENVNLTGEPTATTPDSESNDNRIATTEFVNVLISKLAETLLKTLGELESMIFKGTIGIGGTVTSLPNKHKNGETYKVITAGIYSGHKCEVGDMISCIKTSDTANDSDWVVYQGNTDGVVVGPTSVESGSIALYDGITGKLIKSLPNGLSKQILSMNETGTEPEWIDPPVIPEIITKQISLSDFTEVEFSNGSSVRYYTINGLNMKDTSYGVSVTPSIDVNPMNELNSEIIGNFGETFIANKTTDGFRVYTTCTADELSSALIKYEIIIK